MSGPMAPQAGHQEVSFVFEKISIGAVDTPELVDRLAKRDQMCSKMWHSNRLLPAYPVDVHIFPKICPVILRRVGF